MELRFNGSALKICWNDFNCLRAGVWNWLTIIIGSQYTGIQCRTRSVIVKVLNSLQLFRSLTGPSFHLIFLSYRVTLRTNIEQFLDGFVGLFLVNSKKKCFKFLSVSSVEVKLVCTKVSKILFVECSSWKTKLDWCDGMVVCRPCKIAHLTVFNISRTVGEAGFKAIFSRKTLQFSKCHRKVLQSWLCRSKYMVGWGVTSTAYTIHIWCMMHDGKRWRSISALVNQMNFPHLRWTFRASVSSCLGCINQRSLFSLMSKTIPNMIDGIDDTSALFWTIFWIKVIQSHKKRTYNRNKPIGCYTLVIIYTETRFLYSTSYDPLIPNEFNSRACFSEFILFDINIFSTTITTTHTLGFDNRNSIQFYYYSWERFASSVVLVGGLEINNLKLFHDLYTRNGWCGWYKNKFIKK